MLDGWILDWSTTLVLAAIVVLEGVRRVPEGAYILRKSPGAGWSVVEGPMEHRRWRLASSLAPVAMHVVVAPPAGELGTRDPAGREEIERLVRSLRWRIIALRLLGAGVLVGVVLAVPTITARFGGRGLLASLGGVFALSLVTAAVSAMAVRHALGETRRSTARATLGILSPFVAPRAAEIVLERALSHAAPIVAARALLPGDRFAAWVRPRAYDQLEPALTREECRAIIDAPPAGRDGEPYCPRCGGLYRPDVVRCPSCEGIALRHA